VDATASKYARGHFLQPEWTREELRFVSALRYFLPPRLALDTIIVVASPGT
jgi:hypothetical protein